MKAIIVEDEIMAGQNLQRLIGLVEPEMEVVTVLKSVEESVEWFASHPAPDVVFMDIHLSDGSSFNIFDKVDMACPVIFTTAYDQYALNAFKVNGIDYLLKPVDRDELRRAITKFKALTVKAVDGDVVGMLLSALREEKGREYKSRLLIPHKDKFLSLDVEDIAYVYAENKVSRIVSRKGNEYRMNLSLEELSKQLDPSLFFRANRQFIVSRPAVKDIYTWFDSKLALNLNVETPEKIIISRARVQDFKSWYTS